MAEKCYTDDTVDLEERGVNESIMIGLHEEVVEMMETESTSLLTETTHETVMPYCTCSVRSTCQTNRCPCKASKYGCHCSRCKCNPRRCKNQMAEASVNINEYGGGRTSGEEQDWCVCTNQCTVNCFCHLKKRPCDPFHCKCKPGACKNPVKRAEVTTDEKTGIEEEVKEFMATKSKEEVQEVIIKVAKLYPCVWRSATGASTASYRNPNPASWCKCGKCQPEEDPQDRICCKNHARNHENPVFDRIVLDEHTIEVALMNNADWLNLPRIFTPAKMRNTAYRQYILWFWGKLGYKNRKRIPSCIKWQIRGRYPEEDGNYQGYKEAY